MVKKLVTAALLSVAALLTLPDRSSAAVNVDISVNIGVFQERLRPYGEWISVGRYGTCWRPQRVSRTWRPYTVGYWTYTDYGWTWVSEEDWGWATYHYGRWVFDRQYGWVWVPGRTWAPAYVAWRYGNGYIGWAPLPPRVQPRYVVNIDRVIAPSSYTFVEARYFPDRQLTTRFVEPSRYPRLIESTRNYTRYDVQGSRIVDRGVDVREIERVSGQPVARFRIRDAGEVTGAPRTRVANNEVSVYRPSVDRGRNASRVDAAAPRPVRQRDRRAQIDSQRSLPGPQPRATRGRLRQEQAVGIDHQTLRVKTHGRAARDAQRAGAPPQAGRVNVAPFANVGHGGGIAGDRGPREKKHARSNAVVAQAAGEPRGKGHRRSAQAEQGGGEGGPGKHGGGNGGGDGGGKHGGGDGGAKHGGGDGGGKHGGGEGGGHGGGHGKK